MRKEMFTMSVTNRTKGILCILAAALCFSGMSAFVRLAGELPVFEKAFFRNFVAAIVAGVTLYRSGTPFRIPKENRRFVLCRAIFGTVGLVAKAIEYLANAEFVTGDVLSVSGGYIM